MNVVTASDSTQNSSTRARTVGYVAEVSPNCKTRRLEHKRKVGVRKERVCNVQITKAEEALWTSTPTPLAAVRLLLL